MILHFLIFVGNGVNVVHWSCLLLSYSMSYYVAVVALLKSEFEFEDNTFYLILSLLILPNTWPPNSQYLNSMELMVVPVPGTIVHPHRSPVHMAA